MGVSTNRRLMGYLKIRGRIMVGLPDLGGFVVKVALKKMFSASLEIEVDINN